jgi:hypothetical protein
MNGHSLKSALNLISQIYDKRFRNAKFYFFEKVYRESTPPGKMEINVTAKYCNHPGGSGGIIVNQTL